MAFMVVGLHAAFLQDLTSFGDHILRNGVFRLAVPVFLVINGFYFWPVVQNERYLGWLRRVFILYIIWMAVYAVMWLPIGDLTPTGFAKSLRISIFGYFHLWYLAGMLGAAVLLLIMRKFSSAVIGASIAATLVVGIVLDYAGNYQLFDGSIDTALNATWLHRNALFFSYPFFTIGYLMNKHSVGERFTKLSSGALAVFGLLLLLAESTINYDRIESEKGFDNLVSIIILAPALFMFFTKLNVPGKTKTIAYYASSIYFVHIGVLLALNKLDWGGTITTVVTIALASAISFFVVRLNAKIGYIL